MARSGKMTTEADVIKLNEFLTEKTRKLIADLESGNYDHAVIDDAKKQRLLRTAKRILGEVTRYWNCVIQRVQR